jgi:hypothetical protein
VAAACATLLVLVFFFSWFYHGGSPHGATPSSGRWRFAGRIGAYLLIASIVLSAFGRGKWRLFILGWAASLAFVSYAILMLDMD